MSETVLAVERLTKHFVETVALDEVTLALRAHEVLGLVGENGSGKSTLLKILGGVVRPDSGRILVRGQAVQFSGVADAIASGIGMVYQEQSLVPNITVAENILLGQEGSAVRWGWYNWKQLRQQASIALHQLGLDIDPMARTESLSFAERQMVEIAKVLFLENRRHVAPIILLDEPTSVLESKEIDTLFGQIRRLREVGSVVFVSHRLGEVLDVSDRIYVLRNGRCVGEREAKQSRHDDLYEMMIGRSPGQSYYHEESRLPFDEGRPVLSLDGLSARKRYSDVSFEIHAGEVLALTGLIGSGCESVCRTIFGAEPFERGLMRLEGVKISPGSPADAVAMGIGYVPAERRIEGVVGGMNVAANMILADPGVAARRGLLDFRRWRTLVAGWIERLRIKPASPRADVTALSGGNQQKVVLAKWLLRSNLKVLLLDHPARGLDVGAKTEVYALIRRLAQQGLAVLLLADSIDEAIGLSHSVVVMRDGLVSGRFSASPGRKPLEAEIIKCMT